MIVRTQEVHLFGAAETCFDYLFANRKLGDEVKCEGHFFLWNGSRFTHDGLLSEYFILTDIEIHGVIPTPSEMKRFQTFKSIEVCRIFVPFFGKKK